jgi:hypothetical protein
MSPAAMAESRWTLADLSLQQINNKTLREALWTLHACQQLRVSIMRQFGYPPERIGPELAQSAVVIKALEALL